MYTLSNIYDAVRNGKVYSDYPMADEQGKYRKLDEPVAFKLSNGRLLVISEGFEWDENSIPFIFQPLFPKSGIYAVPALIHDALYYLTEGDQKFADMEYAMWMCALRLKPKQIAFRLIGVDAFGDKWWRRNLYNPKGRCLRNRKLIKLV